MFKWAVRFFLLQISKHRYCYDETIAEFTRNKIIKLRWIFQWSFIPHACRFLAISMGGGWRIQNWGVFSRSESCEWMELAGWPERLLNWIRKLFRQRIAPPAWHIAVEDLHRQILDAQFPPSAQFSSLSCGKFEQMIGWRTYPPSPPWLVPILCVILDSSLHRGSENRQNTSIVMSLTCEAYFSMCEWKLLYNIAFSIT